MSDENLQNQQKEAFLNALFQNGTYAIPRFLFRRRNSAPGGGLSVVCQTSW